MIVRKNATLERFQGKQAILRLENGAELAILREDLEPTGEIGREYTVQILPADEAKLEQDALARLLLNQILENDEQEAGRKAS